MYETSQRLHRWKGFTLIELSIVLVIIGLIIGGVLAGKDLIRAAEVRHTISQVEQTKTAVNTFYNKYNCLPGDCANASKFFAGAVNGNGDGQISQNPANVNVLEPYNAWSHLSAAGLIAGNFSPFTDADYDSNNDIQNFNLPPLGPQMLAPSAALSGTFLTIFYFAPGDDFWPNLMAGGNYIALSQVPFGDQFTAFGTSMVQAEVDMYLFSGGGAGTADGLYPQDAFAIDSKMDDGLPLKGNVSVLSFVGDTLGCITQTGNIVYDMSAAGNIPTCIIFTPLGM